VEDGTGLVDGMVLARQRQAVAKKPHGSGTQKTGGRGTARLRAAADLYLEVFSEEIVQTLLDKTVGGNTTAARILFALAEGLIDCENQEVMQQLCSYADKLAAEPKWPGKTIEGTVQPRSDESKTEVENPARLQ
jgi:hypothetical protein